MSRGQAAWDQRKQSQEPTDSTTAPVRRLVSLSSSLKRGLQKLEAVFELPVLLRKARSARSPIWDVPRIQAVLRTFRALLRQVEKKIVGNERKGR